MRDAFMISIDYRDARPIYEQIRDSYRTLIMAGLLVPGSKMPSVRQLARDLAVNPNTIQRAFRELESEGFVYSVPGRGTFVSSEEGARAGRLNDLYERFDAVVDELLSAGASRETLARRVLDDVSGEANDDDRD